MQLNCPKFQLCFLPEHTCLIPFLLIPPWRRLKRWVSSNTSSLPKFLLVVNLLTEQSVNYHRPFLEKQLGHLTFPPLARMETKLADQLLRAALGSFSQESLSLDKLKDACRAQERANTREEESFKRERAIKTWVYPSYFMSGFFFLLEPVKIRKIIAQVPPKKAYFSWILHGS